MQSIIDNKWKINIHEGNKTLKCSHDFVLLLLRHGIHLHRCIS